MEEIQIQRSYKAFALITLIVSIINIVFASAPIGERIWQAFLLNLGYHFFYFALGRIPIWQYKSTVNHNPKMRNLSRFMLKWFLGVVIAISFLGALAVVYLAFSGDDYQQLAVLPWFVSVFLGSYSSRRKIIAGN